MSAPFVGDVTQFKIDNLTSAAGGSRTVDFDNMGLLDLSYGAVPRYGPSVTPAPFGKNTATDTVYNATVVPQAEVNASAPSITLRWRKNIAATTYTVTRKLPSESTYGYTVATNVSSDVNYCVDTNVTPGVIYDYKIARNSAIGYISAGINISHPQSKGKVILLIDNSIKDKISDELQTLRADLIGEGWTVIDSFANRTDAPESIRSNIKAIYNADTANVNTLFIIGRVPIKYYGYLSPDGHERRAFACDQFYGDMTESNVWLSDAQCQTNSTYVIPGNIQLQVGRVDFFNMPSFSAEDGKNMGEVALLKRYFKKDHYFRTGKINVARKSFLDDRLFSYSLATNNFAQITGGIYSMDYNKAVTAPTNPTGSVFKWYAEANHYLWGLKLGYGSDLSCGTLDATTSDYTTYQDKNIMFMGMYGSYFGDWHKKDNLMRATLTGKNGGLGVMWINTDTNLRPLGLGKTIGSSILEWQNTYKTIQSQLMGDPTLTMYPSKTVSNVKAVKNASDIYTVMWDAVPGSAGYYVYMANDSSSAFTLRTPTPVVSTIFVDTATAPATAIYMVRPYKIETTPSGTFYNLATGTMSSRPDIADFSIDNLRFTDENGLTLLTAKNAASITAHAMLSNNFPVDKSCSFVMALYQGTPANYKLVQTDIVTTSVKSLEEQKLKATVQVPATGNYFIKLFVWDDTLKAPLAQKIVFPTT